ncbi:unnamed protein product [Urochloa humidicola]
MSSPSSWLLSDNSRYSTRARVLFMGLSFAIGILTFLLYLALWYLCSSRRRRHRLQQQQQRGAAMAAAAAAGGEHGMSADAIAALPTFVFAPSGDGDADPEAPSVDCPVCLGQVEAGEKVRRLPKCGHSFHAECVDAWLRAHSTCPMCRAAVGQAAAATATKQHQQLAAAADNTVAAPAPAEAALPPV